MNKSGCFAITDNAMSLQRDPDYDRFKTMVNLTDLLKKLFGQPAPPCAEWPAVSCLPPEVDTRQNLIGKLAFGDHIQTASFFGRPTAFKNSSSGYLQMLYASAGFEIDFDNDQLAYAAFFLNHDEYIEWQEEIVFSSPIIDGICFNSKNKIEDVKNVYGPAFKIDETDDEIILFYRQGKLQIEFEANSDTSLKRINLYPF